MPFANEHACRVNPPDKYVRLRRQNGIGDVDGKRLDAIIGFKEGGGSEVQAFRYPKSEGWSAAQARTHCGSHEGSFEAATNGEESMKIDPWKQWEFEMLESYRQGLSDAPVLYRAMGFPLEKEAVQEPGIMTVVASEESEDRLGDIIKVDAWELDNFRKNPILMWSHDYNRPPIGIVPKIWKQEKQLLAQVKWDEMDDFAMQIKGKYERKHLRAVSVGFRALEFEYHKEDQMNSKGVIFTKAELLEISACAVPANPYTLMKAVALRPFYIEIPQILKQEKEFQAEILSDLDLETILASTRKLKEVW